MSEIPAPMARLLVAAHVQSLGCTLGDDDFIRDQVGRKRGRFLGAELKDGQWQAKVELVDAVSFIECKVTVKDIKA